jgi:hypothetical protein
MNNKVELIKRAYDANTFDSGDTAAGYINPEYWDRAVLDHVKTNMVSLQFGMDKSSLMGDGDAYNITIHAEPAAAAAVAESANVAVVAFAPTTAVLTPTEYGVAYSVTDKELRRAFLDVMSQMVSQIGHSLARKADGLVIADLTTNAGNSVVADSVASSVLASSNTIDHLDVISAMKLNSVDLHDQHVGLLVRPEQHASLTSDATFLTADKFGSGAGNQVGFVGSVMGVPVFQTTQITVTSSIAHALLISSRDSFAYGFKNTGGVKSQYYARGRYTELVGVIDFDTVVTRANAICKIQTWAE